MFLWFKYEIQFSIGKNAWSGFPLSFRENRWREYPLFAKQKLKRVKSEACECNLNLRVNFQKCFWQFFCFKYVKPTPSRRRKQFEHKRERFVWKFSRNFSFCTNWFLNKFTYFCDLFDFCFLYWEMKDNGKNSSPLVNDMEALNHPTTGSLNVSLNLSLSEESRDVNDTPNALLSEVNYNRGRILYFLLRNNFW